MKSVNYYKLSIVIIISFLVMTHLLLAQNKASWHVSNIKSSITQEITGHMMGSEKTVTADHGNIIVTIIGLFRPADEEASSIKVSEIQLLSKSIQSGNTATWKVSPVGIGITLKDGTCHYMFPEDHVKGDRSLGLESSGRFKISRDNESAPAVLTIEESPTKMCFAFTVPQEIKSNLKLRFDDTDVDVPIPR